MIKKTTSLFALLFLAPLWLQAQMVKTDQLNLELISEVQKIQPGTPFTVALKFDIKDHWHIYWSNPGDSGLSPKVTWDLPEGFTAGDLQFPYPIFIPTPPLATFGYEGTALFLTEITPPATLPAGPLEIKADATSPVCKEGCLPRKGSVRVTLPHPVDHAQTVSDARNQLPLPRNPSGSTSQKYEDKITLNIPASQLASSEAKIRFFPTDPYTYDHVADQPLETTPNGVTLTILRADPEEDPEALQGVLVSDTGWHGTDRKALLIDLPFGEAPAAAGSTSPATNDASLSLGVLLAAFIGGLILNLMPCVFPVLGLKIMSFVQQAGESRAKIVGHGLWFTFGVLVSFWVLAGALIAIRAGGQELGWGFQLQSPLFVYALALLLLAFALNLSGVFEVGTSLTAVGGKYSEGHGYGGTFFSGVLATLVATPCAAPFLAPALGAALALPATSSMVVFTFVALGLSTPYLLFSVFPALIEKLPRPGPWMETFKQGMAFLLYGTVAYLVWVLLGQVSEQGALLVLFGLVLTALAVWTLGRFAPFGAPPKKKWITRIVSLLLILSAFNLGTRASAPSEITWEKWSPETVERMIDEGKTVYVDFTARWCATCQVNKKVVFSSDEIIHTFNDRGIIALKADWTNHDPEITRALESFGRSAVPFNLIYAPGREAPIELPELLTPGIVLDALEK